MQIGNYNITDKEIDQYIATLAPEQQMYKDVPAFREQVKSRLEEISLFAMEGEEKHLDETEEYKNTLSVVRRDVLGQLAMAEIINDVDVTDEEVKNIGTIESMGTAYPIAYDETGIYAASGHDMQRFEIEKSGSLRLAEGIYEQFDESGNAAYTMKKGEETDVITEEEYYAAFEKYSNATIVNFSYGASDAGKAEVVTNNELEPRQGNIAEDVNVLEIVQETASEFAVKKMETSYF